MKIVFVAMADNIHSARWISQLVGSGHELHLYPAIPNRQLHSLIREKVYYHPFPWLTPPLPRLINPQQKFIIDYSNRALLHLMSSDSHAISLAHYIEHIKPDLVHSLEFQSSGYLTLKAKQLVKTTFPKWLVTNWGSDIFYFGNLEGHKEKIKSLLNESNFYSCECSRDIELAKQFGFRGKTYLSTTNTGGYDLNWININQVKNASERKIIMLKGYQNWSGRAQVAIEALERVGSLLRGYELVLYNINPPNAELINRANSLATQHGMRLSIVPLNTNHEEILKLHGKARVSIGLSLSDALSTSAIEAMLMGSFPIQSNTSCIDTHVKDGVNGFLVPPEDTKLISARISESLTNDNLIDKAYEYNQLYIAPKFEYKKLQNESLKMYQDIFND